MTLGPRSMVRCERVPTVVISELVPATDGQCGSMSMCPRCFDVFRQLKPGWVRTYAKRTITE